MNKKEAGRILIIGATGFVGKHMVTRLAREKYKLRALVRKTSNPVDVEYLKQYGCELAEGDVHDYPSLVQAMHGCHTIIHLVGIIQEHPKEGVTFERMHVGSTRNIVNACHAAKVQRIVYFSALGTSPHCNNRYHQTKYEAEQLIKTSRIPFIIFRPAVIAGKGDKSINFFAKLVRYFPLVPVIAPSAMLQPIFVDDLMKCVAKSLTSNRYLSRIFEICGPDALSIKEIFETIAMVLGKRRLFIPLPLFFEKLIAFFGQLFPRPPITFEQLKMLQHPNVCNFEAAEKEFGMIFMPFKTTISTYIPR